MAGEALTSKFMLASATLMFGPQEDLFSLNPGEHSVGLVKNITFRSAPSFIDLTQGVKNTTVFTVMNGNKLTVAGEMYEYTMKNLAYAGGLDGSEIVPFTVAATVTTAMPLTSGETALVIPATVTTGFSAGDWVAVELPGDDRVYHRKLASVEANTSLTIVTAQGGFPEAIPLNTPIRKVNVVGMGSKDDQPFLACKIAGNLADGSPVTILIPKVRVTSGISMAFKTDAYDNIPLELSVYDLVTTDPFYDTVQEFGGASALVMD